MQRMQKKIAPYLEAEQKITFCANRLCQSDISQNLLQNCMAKWKPQRHSLLTWQSYLLLFILIFDILPCYSNADKVLSSSEKVIQDILSHINYSEYQYILDSVIPEVPPTLPEETPSPPTETEPVPVIPQGGKVGTSDYTCNTRIFSKFTRDMVSGFTGNDPLPHGYISRDDDGVAYGPKAEEHKWGDLLNRYSSLNSLVMFILFLAILIPLLGLIYFCCRLRGKCGARSQSCEKKNDKMLCICLSLLLLLLLIFIIPPLFYAFKSNIYLQKGLSELKEGKYGGIIHQRSPPTTESPPTEPPAPTQSPPPKVHPLSPESRIKQAQNYADHVLITNYEEFYDGLEKRVKAAVEYLKKEFLSKTEGYSKTVNVANELFPKLIESANIENVEGIKLTSRLAEYTDILRACKRAMIKALFGSNDNDRTAVATRKDPFIYGLDATNFAYPLVEYLHKLELFVTRVKAMHDISSGGAKTDEKVKQVLSSTEPMFPPRVMDVLKNVGPELKEYADKLKSALNGVKPDLPLEKNIEGKAIGEGDGDNSKNGNDNNNKKNKDEVKSMGFPTYLIFVGLAVCIILLLIIILMIAALLCGIFGKRRDDARGKLCNKGLATRLFILALYLIFIFYALIALVLIIHLLLGTVAYRGICNTKGKQSDSNPISNERRITREVNDKTVCISDQNFYKILRSKNEIGDIREIEKYSVKYSMKPEILKLEDYYNYTQYSPFYVELTENTYKRQMLLYLTIGWKYLDHRITHSVAKAQEKYQIMFNKNLKSDRFKDRPGFGNWFMKTFPYQIKEPVFVPLARFRKIIPNDFDKLEKNWLQRQKEYDELLNKAFSGKGNDVNKFSLGFFSDALSLEAWIMKEMPDITNMVMKKLHDYCDAEFDIYLKRSVYLIENKVGVCPKERAKRSSSTSTTDSSSAAICYCVVDPINAFWFFLLLCALLLLPMLLLVPCLAYLLSKPCKYEDTRSEKEEAPLVPKGGKRKKDERPLSLVEKPLDQAYEPKKKFKQASIIIDCKGGGIRIGCVPSDYHSKSESFESLEKCEEDIKRKGNAESKSESCYVKHTEKSKSSDIKHIECATGGIISIDCCGSGERKYSKNTKASGRRQNECAPRQIISIDCGKNDKDNRPCGSRPHEYSGRRHFPIGREPNDDDNDNRPSGSRQHEYSGRRYVSIDYVPNNNTNRPFVNRQHSGRKKFSIDCEPNKNDNRPSGSRQYESDCRRSERNHSKRRPSGVISIDFNRAREKQKKTDTNPKERQKLTTVNRTSNALPPTKHSILKTSDTCECSTSMRSRRAPTENEPERSLLNNPMTVVIKKTKYKNPKSYCGDKNS